MVTVDSGPALHKVQISDVKIRETYVYIHMTTERYSPAGISTFKLGVGALDEAFGLMRPQNLISSKYHTHAHESDHVSVCGHK